jgi:hypothetical protein
LELRNAAARCHESQGGLQRAAKLPHSRKRLVFWGNFGRPTESGSFGSSDSQFAVSEIKVPSNVKNGASRHQQVKEFRMMFPPPIRRAVNTLVLK